MSWYVFTCSGKGLPRRPTNVDFQSKTARYLCELRIGTAMSIMCIHHSVASVSLTPLHAGRQNVVVHVDDLNDNALMQLSGRALLHTALQQAWAPDEAAASQAAYAPHRSHKSNLALS